MKAVPQGIEIEQIADQPKVVEHAVGEFVHSFIEALAIVLFVSFVALGWRTGIVVAMSVPLVLAIVFIVMNAMSLDLHRITLGALIIALGLLVDDAIIAVEMMVVKIGTGLGPHPCGVLCLGIYRVSDAHGNAGHGRWLPPHRLCQFGGRRICRRHLLDRGDSLIASWFVAVVFTPYIGVKLLPNIKVHLNHDPHAVYETRVYRVLRSMIQWCVDHRVKVVVATVGVFIASRSSASAMSSSSSSRCPSGPNCSCSCACRKAPPSTSRRSRSRQRKRCSRTTRTSRPTPPMSARARRASGSASTRNCRTRPSPRS